MKKYIIFDFEGTLIKSNDNNHSLTIDYISKKHSIDREKLRYIFSQSKETSLMDKMTKHLNIPQEDAGQTSEEIYKLIRKNNNSPFIEGVPNIIRKLSKTYVLFISTMNSTKFVVEKLQSENLLELFTHIQGSECVVKGSEHIQIMRDITGDINFEKRSIFVGDGSRDRQIALENNIDFIHIDPFLKNEYGDMHEIDSVKNIENVLSLINKKELP